MIQQNINLLDLIKGTKRDKYNFSIKKFIWVNVFFNVVMIAMAISSLLNLQDVSTKNALLNAELTSQSRILANLQSHFPKIFFEKSNDASQKMRQEIVLSKKILDRLAGTLSFSSMLEILSKDIVSQVWLTKISFLNQSNDIILNGKSYSEKQLENFITNLSKNKRFSNYTLNVNRLERSSENKNVIITEFEIKLTGKMV